MFVLLLFGCMAPIVSEKELLGLQENVRINPDSPAAYHNLGIALYYVDHFQEAVKTFKKSIRLRPDARDVC